MGIVGRYIDALSDEQRDRIIEAEEILTGTEFYKEDSCIGCLVHTAEQEHGPQYQRYPIAQGWKVDYYLNMPAFKFVLLAERFGDERIIHLCKSRAAKNNRSISVEIDIGELANVKVEVG